MLLKDLDEKLGELGVPLDFYSLYGDPLPGRTVFDKLPFGRFKVFDVDERGGIHKEKHFDKEEDAANYLYEEMKNEARHMSEEYRQKNRELYYNQKK
jgi:hypothetical protein